MLDVPKIILRLLAKIDINQEEKIVLTKFLVKLLLIEQTGQTCVLGMCWECHLLGME